MTASYAYLNERLAGLHGVTAVVEADLQKVDLDPKDRAGILTQVAMLLGGSFTPSNDTDPPARGQTIRNLFYCYPLFPLTGVSPLRGPMQQDSNRQYFELLTSGHSGSGLDLRALIAAVTETEAFLAPAGSKADGGTDAGASDGGVVSGPLPEGCAMSPTIFNGFNGGCISCHNAGSAPAFGGLDMVTPGWESKLVGAPPPAGAPGTNACNTHLNYLNRTQPATGLLLDKLKASPPCGAQMPLAAVAPPLSASELACIQKWANNVVAGETGQ
jgi:hypothetical protein